MLRVFLFILSTLSVVVVAQRYYDGYYDCQSCIDRYPDLAKAFGNDCSDPVTRDAAWRHWVEKGVEEGRDASPEFDYDGKLKPKPKPKGYFGWGIGPRYSYKDVRPRDVYKDIQPRYIYKDISYDKMDRKYPKQTDESSRSRVDVLDQKRKEKRTRQPSSNKDRKGKPSSDKDKKGKPSSDKGKKGRVYESESAEEEQRDLRDSFVDIRVDGDGYTDYPRDSRYSGGLRGSRIPSSPSSPSSIGVAGVPGLGVPSGVTYSSGRYWRPNHVGILIEVQPRMNYNIPQVVPETLVPAGNVYADGMLLRRTSEETFVLNKRPMYGFPRVVISTPTSSTMSLLDIEENDDESM
jgi:hypothetical protein